ncbi:S8 family peptidase [Tumebacillus lipolyticus]|uniref:S8 family serine peptidase n=1 Tax=Tumebacillus lipolyticus TaxID=1280370 RepID=A0ABW4ZSS9_9BACL
MKKVMTALVATAFLASLTPTASAETSKGEPDFAQDRVLVKMKPGKDEKDLTNRYDVEKVLDLQEWKVLKVKAGDAKTMKEKLIGEWDVADVELDYVVHSATYWSDDRCPTPPPKPFPGPRPPYFDKLNLLKAWEKTLGSKERTIGLFDTGVDLEHKGLIDKLVSGYDFVERSSNPIDQNGHGTYVAGIMAGAANEELGSSGIDPSAMIMPLRVLDKEGVGYTSNVLEAMYYAVEKGVNVFNLSLAGGEYSDAFQDTINYSFEKGVVIVAAAGDDGGEKAVFPAAYENVLSVGAVDQEFKPADFSNYGGWVSLAAPGVGMETTARSGGIVTDLKGSSYSAAFVSGLTTLTWSTNLQMSNKEVIERLLNTAKQIEGTEKYTKYGLINPYDAIFY